MNDVTKNLDQLLEQMRRGKNTLPASDTETRELLSIAQLGMSVPRHKAPRPIKQHKYQLLAKKQGAWSGAFLKMLTAGFAILVFVLLGAWSSVPNQRLFTVKKAVEQARIDLARNPEQKAAMQLSLVEKRISEAETIFASSDTSENSKAAALEELASQTKLASETVKVAAAQEGSGQPTSSPLIHSLGDIAKKQETLLSKIPEQEKSTESTKKSFDEEKTKTAIAEVKNILATVNEQTLASLPAAEVTQTGIITKITKESITIDTTSFSINDSTKIFGSDEKAELKITSLTEKQKVTVVGTNGKDGLLATKITVLNEPKPEVKGQTTPKKPQPQKEQPAETPEQQENTAQAGFIYEDPAPQFVP